jgi:hypothetical protein
VTLHIVVSILAIGIPVAWAIYVLATTPFVDMWLHPLLAVVSAVGASLLVAGPERIGHAGGLAFAIPAGALAIAPILLDSTFWWMAVFGVMTGKMEKVPGWWHVLVAALALYVAIACDVLLAGGWA